MYINYRVLSNSILKIREIIHTGLALNEHVYSCYHSKSEQMNNKLSVQSFCIFDVLALLKRFFGQLIKWLTSAD